MEVFVDHSMSCRTSFPCDSVGLNHFQAVWLASAYSRLLGWSVSFMLPESLQVTLRTTQFTYSFGWGGLFNQVIFRDFLKLFRGFALSRSGTILEDKMFHLPLDYSNISLTCKHSSSKSCALLFFYLLYIYINIFPQYERLFPQRKLL